MEKQELLNILYSERQRLSDRYARPGWNNWVLLGSILYCILSSIDLFNKNTFVISHVFELLGLMFFWIFTVLLFSHKILGEIRGFIEELFLLTSIKKMLKTVKWILRCSLVIYCLNIIVNIINSFKKMSTIDFFSIMIIISWILLILFFIGICLTSMIDKKTIRSFKSLSLGNLSIFTSLMLINYFKDWTIFDLQFSIIFVVFIITTTLLWYTNIEKDISSIDDLIDDVIIFDIPDTDSVINQLKIITINTSLDSLYTFKVSRVNNLKVQIYRLLVDLSKVVNQIDADYFRKDDAKKIRENFYSKIGEVLKLKKDLDFSLGQMLTELSGANESLKSIRKKRRVYNTIEIIRGLIDESKELGTMCENIVEAIEKIPKCVLCENCPINCDDIINQMMIDE